MYDKEFLNDQNTNDELGSSEMTSDDHVAEHTPIEEIQEIASADAEPDVELNDIPKVDDTFEKSSSDVDDGTYHHSYINSDTYNPNKNSYSDNIYSGYGDSYNDQRNVYSNSNPYSSVNSNNAQSTGTSQNSNYNRGYQSQAQYQSSAQQPQQTYYRNPYNTSNGYGNMNQQYNQKPKKEKKARIGAGTVAILLVVCIIVSGLCGFGGMMLYNTVNKNESVTDGSLVVHQVSAETQKATDGLVDKTTSEIAAEVADSVVEITTEVMTTNSFYGQMVQEGAGSGVIISDDGYIVTNNHVIDGASKIQVTLKNGDAYEAKLVGTDAQEDTALIKIEATGLTEVVFGDSDTIKVGDKAVAIGNPLGTLGGTVTDGIISALDRKIEIDGETMTLLQTDTAINPGNSGGGLFNGQGELIGIVSAKSTGDEVDNLGFAIPINNVLNILSDLKEYGYVTGRPSLGVDLIDISNKMYSMYYFNSENTGVFINSVTSTTANEAGLKPGDRIVSINGTEVNTSSEVEELIEELAVGDEVSVEVERSGKTGTVKVKLEEMKQETKSIVPDSDEGSYDDFYNPFG